jgi:hypothetical protein
VAYQSDEFLNLVSGFESFDLQVADMDFDGKDEIIVPDLNMITASINPS